MNCEKSAGKTSLGTPAPSSTWDKFADRTVLDPADKSFEFESIRMCHKEKVQKTEHLGSSRTVKSGIPLKLNHHGSG
jgi:hypothetical protein